jgi:hypothetical protein
MLADRSVAWLSVFLRMECRPERRHSNDCELGDGEHEGLNFIEHVAWN